MLRDRARLCMKLNYTADVPKEPHPIEIDFFASTMGITSALGQRPGNAPTPYPLSDNEPISYCGNYTYDTMCIRAKWTELVK